MPETVVIGRSAESIVEGETGGLFSIALALQDLGSALYVAGETFRYDDGNAVAVELTRRIDELATFAEGLSLAKDGTLTTHRECDCCSGDGKDWGLQEPERSMNPCPECDGHGYVNAEEPNG